MSDVTNEHDLPETLSSLFLYRGDVYSVPSDCVFHNHRDASSISMVDFDNRMAGWTDNLLNVDAFLGLQDVGSRGYSENKIVIVKTKRGFVWASRLQIRLTPEDQARLGVGVGEIGMSFLWPWYPSKAVHAFEGVSQKTINDGIFRELTTYEPTRAIVDAHIFSPDTIDGAKKLSLAELTPGQRVFAFMIAPSRSWSTPRCANDDYKYRVRSHIDRKQTSAAWRQASEKTSAELIFDREPPRVSDQCIDWDSSSLDAWKTIVARQKLSRKSFPKVSSLLGDDDGNSANRRCLSPVRRSISAEIKRVVDYMDLSDGEIFVYEPVDVFEALPWDVTQMVISVAVQKAWDSANPIEAMGTFCALRSTSRKLRQQADENLFKIFSSTLRQGLSDEKLVPHHSRIGASHLNFALGAPLAKSLFSEGLSCDGDLRFQQIRAMISYMQSRSGLIKSRHLKERPNEQTRRMLTFLQRKPFQPVRIDPGAKARKFLDPWVMTKVIDDCGPVGNENEIFNLVSYIRNLNPLASGANHAASFETSWVPDCIFAMEDGGPMSDAAIN